MIAGFRQAYIALALLILSACSAPAGSQQERFLPSQPVTSLVYNTAIGTAQGAWVAAQMPLEDLNLKQTPIPLKLQQTADSPYAMPSPLSCTRLKYEIAQLDALLGPDVCTPQNPTGAPPAPASPEITVCTPKNPTGASRRGEYVNQGADMARQRAISEVSGKVNVIPFRSMVRYASGAEKHAKAVEKAYQAGKLRRAFLKGLLVALGQNCPDAPIMPVR